MLQDKQQRLVSHRTCVDTFLFHLRTTEWQMRSLICLAVIWNLSNVITASFLCSSTNKSLDDQEKKNHTASPFSLLSIQQIHYKHLTPPHHKLHIVDHTKHTVCLQCLQQKTDGGWIIICPTVINTPWSHDQCWKACLLQAIYHCMRGWLWTVCNFWRESAQCTWMDDVIREIKKLKRQSCFHEET